MRLYDEEQMIRDIETTFKAKLNDEIAVINAEKADSLTLDTIASDKYIFETLDKRVQNYKGFFILYYKKKL